MSENNNSDLDNPVMKVPNWKEKDIQRAKDIDNQVNATVIEQNEKLNELGGVVTTLPKWKERDLQRAKEIEQQVNATIEEQNAQFNELGGVVSAIPKWKEKDIQRAKEIDEKVNATIEEENAQLSGVVSAIPKWKEKDLQRAKEIEQQVNATIEEQNTQFDELGGVISAIPKWKEKDIQRAKEIDDQVNATIEEQNTQFNELGGVVSTMPKWKEKDLQRAKEIDDQVNATRAEATAQAQEELGGAVMAVPKWKQKQLQKAKEIQAQVDATIAQNAEPQISDEEFEKILDVIGIPEAQRPTMRTFDNKKRNVLKSQADAKTAQETAQKAAQKEANETHQEGEELGNAVMAVPKWKQKQLQKAREIQAQVDATKAQHAEPQISDEEFEKILDKINVPEFQRVEMRKFDNKKRKLLKEQAENQQADEPNTALIARGNPRPQTSPEPPKKHISRIKSLKIFSRNTPTQRLSEDVLENERDTSSSTASASSRGSISGTFKKSMHSIKTKLGHQDKQMEKISEEGKRAVSSDN